MLRFFELGLNGGGVAVTTVLAQVTDSALDEQSWILAQNCGYAWSTTRNGQHALIQLNKSADLCKH